MSRAAARLRRLEKRAARDPSIEVWHELVDRLGVFERLGPWTPGPPETMTRKQLDAGPPEGVRRIVVSHVEGESHAQD